MPVCVPRAFSNTAGRVYRGALDHCAEPTGLRQETPSPRNPSAEVLKLLIGLILIAAALKVSGLIVHDQSANPHIPDRGRATRLVVDLLSSR